MGLPRGASQRRLAAVALPFVLMRRAVHPLHEGRRAQEAAGCEVPDARARRLSPAPLLRVPVRPTGCAGNELREYAIDKGCSFEIWTMNLRT